MFPQSIFLLVFVSCSFGDSVSLDFVTPCSIKDNECIVGLWQKTVAHLVPGRPDLEIPPLDPLKIDSIFVDVPGLVTMKFDGYMLGFKNCIFDIARTTLNKGHFKEALDLYCNISIKGYYDLKANTTAIFGPGSEGLLKANGDCKVKLDNLKFKFLMDFLITRDENDGEVKFILKDGPIGYKYKIGGPVVFSAKDIFLGGQDISEFFISFINQNWRIIMETFGGPFFDKAIELVGDIERAFFKTVPASSYFIENLDQYVIQN